VEFVAAKQFPDRVVAPALRVTFPFSMPFKVPNVEQSSGTGTLIVGSATAQMNGVTSESGADAELGDPGTAETGPGVSATGRPAAPARAPEAMGSLAGLLAPESSPASFDGVSTPGSFGPGLSSASPTEVASPAVASASARPARRNLARSRVVVSQTEIDLQSL